MCSSCVQAIDQDRLLSEGPWADLGTGSGALGIGMARLLSEPFADGASPRNPIQARPCFFSSGTVFWSICRGQIGRKTMWNASTVNSDLLAHEQHLLAVYPDSCGSVDQTHHFRVSPDCRCMALMQVRRRLLGRDTMLKGLVRLAKCR